LIPNVTFGIMLKIFMHVKEKFVFRKIAR